jgi:hypothetical protein
VTPEVVRNPLAERFLDERGLTWELKVIPIADIDIEQSLHNQARINPIDPELVDRYAQAMEAGAVFPAGLFGINGKSGKKIVADANHRVQAHMALKRPMIWAYVFKYDNEAQFRSVSRTANAILNGRDNTEEERLMHAAMFVEQGVDRKTAAVQNGVSVSRLNTYLAAQKARRRFEALGIGHRAYADISDGNCNDLSSSLMDPAVRKGIELLRAGVPSRTIAKVAREAKNSGHTDAQKAQAQVEALQLLDGSRHGGASGLITAKRDTVRLRLLGAFKVVNEIYSSGRAEEFEKELAELGALCDG